mgnify:CR=1 FL=1|tara:strand:- start:800 stop:1360 length:561 start_codon:yes stop_codon:yes gene_type:complete
MDNPPNITPTYWEDSADLMAFRIDDARDRGLEHPDIKDGFFGLLKAIREEFDMFCMKVWGVPEDDLDGTVIANWFTAFATLVLDAGDQNEEIDIPNAAALLPLLIAKQHDYGHMNIQRFGVEGILVRMHDKIARLENLSMRSYDMEDGALCEATEDTIADLVGYCVIASMYSFGIWMLPMQLDDLD